MSRNVLVVGNGAREHALAWALARGPGGVKLFATPGNAGTDGIAENVQLPDTSSETLVRAAAERRVDLVVVGPEAPLVAGVADQLRAAGIACFGPGARAARLEGSKAFAKDFLRRHDIPTAEFRVLESYPHARSYVRQASGPCVVKADGLASGKGVYLADSPAEAERAVHELMIERRMGDAGLRIVVEERLTGVEASLFLVLNGHDAVAFPMARDFKRLLDGDAGPNTGGMAAVSPHPLGTPAVWKRLRSKVIEPLMEALQEERLDYRGLLYVGLMLTERGPMVLEFNCRFGDPETQALALLCDGPWLPLLDAAARGEAMTPPEPQDGVAVARVIAGAGYPEPGGRSVELQGLEEAGQVPEVMLFHAGTRRLDTSVYGGPGRMLTVCAHGETAEQAEERVEQATALLRIEGAQWRTDLLTRLSDRPPQPPSQQQHVPRPDRPLRPAERERGLRVRSEYGPRERAARGPRERTERGPRVRTERGPRERTERGPRVRTEYDPRERAARGPRERYPRSGGAGGRPPRPSGGAGGRYPREGGAPERALRPGGFRGRPGGAPGHAGPRRGSSSGPGGPPRAGGGFRGPRPASPAGPGSGRHTPAGPPRGPRPGGGRSGGAGFGGPRPGGPRPGGGRAGGAGFGGRPGGERSGRPGFGGRPGGARPGGPRSGGARPGGARPGGPRAGARSGVGRPGGGRPGGGRPSGARPGGAGSGGGPHRGGGRPQGGARGPRRGGGGGGGSRG